MAIIPRAQRQVLPNATPLQTVNTGAASVGGIGQGEEALGQGIENAGHGLTKLAIAASQEREDLDDFQTKMALTRFHGEQEKRQSEYDNGIQGDGRDHTAARLSEFDGERDALIQSLPNNKKQREMAMLHTENMRANYGLRSYNAQQNHVDVYKANTITDTAYGQIIPQITGEPETAKSALGQIDAVLGGTKLPDSQKEAVRQNAGNAAGERFADQAGPDAGIQSRKIITDFGANLPTGSAPSAGSTSEAGLSYIKSKEGFAPVAQWDIRQHSGGYGTRAAPGEQFTREKAEARLREETGKVDDYIKENVTAPLTQDQHDALVSFGFNLGTDDIGKLLPDINAGKNDAVASRMRQFNHAGGAVNSGLTQRRDEEAQAFEGKGLAGKGATEALPPTSEGYFVRYLTHNLPQIDARAQKLRQQIEDQQFVQGAVEGRVAFNPYDEDQKKKVDNAFDKAEVAKELFAGNEAAMQHGVEISQVLNYVPKSLSQSIMGLVGQNDPDKRATGYRAAAAIVAKQPYAFDASPNGTKLKADADDYSTLVEGGLSPQEAVAHIDEMKSPDWQKATEVRKKNLEGQAGILAKISDADITSRFNAGWTRFSRPGIPDMGPESANVRADYTNLVKENYIRYGDENLAKGLAAKQLSRLWGVSSVNGSTVVTRYPIEQQYPEVGGTRDYIGAQLTSDVKSATGKDIPLGNILPRADDRTQRELASGKPSYVVVYKDPDTGIPQALPGRFTPDVAKAQGEVSAKFDAGRPAAVARAGDVARGRAAIEPYKPDVLLRDAGQKLYGWFVKPSGAK